MAKEDTTQSGESGAVEVHIQVTGHDDKSQSSAPPSAPVSNPQQQTPPTQQHHSSLNLWLLFAIGWLFPPCWWLAICVGRKYAFVKRHTSRSQTAAWRACLIMGVISAVVLVVVLPASLDSAKGEPRSYYYTLQGPIDGGMLADSHALLAQAFHAALNLPDSYPASNVNLWVAAQPITSRHLLASQKLVFGFQLPGLGLPNALAVDRLVKSDDAATAVVLQLVVFGLVTSAAVGKLIAGFSDELGNLYQEHTMTAGSTTTNDRELLQYPALSMPADACTCRIGYDKARMPMDCPSPWDSAAGTSQVPPALTIVDGALVEQLSGKPAVMHGVNWFGLGTTANFDGLWAYCDDSSTYSNPPCQQDGEIYPYESIGDAAAKAVLNISWWGKRRMTNDFAAVVYRMKLLGFNAVRAQFKFDNLIKDLPYDSSNPEFFPCMLDTDEFIAAKTLDPRLLSPAAEDANRNDLTQHLPQYQGMPHPPPKSGDPHCDDKPWSAPLLPSYKGSTGSSLNLTMCNWYLPQGPGVQALHRFIWQLQYFVSQGFYVLLDFSSTCDREPNMENTELLAQNWGNFWRILTDLPAYKDYMSERIFPDLVNEPSRWGCQWDSSCHETDQNKTCAPILHTFGPAAAAIWRADPNVPIFINGFGQDNSRLSAMCGSSYPGMHWGDGFVTNQLLVQEYDVGTASRLLTAADKLPGPGLVLAPHLYPGSITTDHNSTTQDPANIAERWDNSWGRKAQGLDTDARGNHLPTMPVIVGEVGARDFGNNTISNTDTTVYTQADREWLQATGTYLNHLSEKTDRPMSWSFWAWNANSGDTQGIVGPGTTWREVQWTKVRMLSRVFGLRPWYCSWQPEFCNTVEW